MVVLMHKPTSQYGHFLLTATIIKLLPNQNEKVRWEWIFHAEYNIINALFNIMPICMHFNCNNVSYMRI